MEKENLERLFEAIKKDDVKSFSFIMLSNSDLNISFGRFPILSLLYLFGSYSILSKYEKYLLPIHNFNKVYEPYDAYIELKKKAKKSLRLFAGSDEFIYPILMLAILDERDELKNNYKKLYKNAEICDILSKIYKINIKIDINQTDNTITIPKKKMSLSQKLLVLTSIFVLVLFSLFSVTSIIIMKYVNGLGTKNSPIMISSEKEFVQAIASNKYYKLAKDIEIGESVALKDFKGSIDGDGHKLTLSNRTTSLFKKTSGTIKNLVIYVSLENASISQNFAVLTENNTGKLENVTISGEISILSYNEAEGYFAGMVVTNDGTVSECQVELDVTIINKRSSDAFFAGIVGVNNGKIENSKTLPSKFSADTIDISGIATTNNGEIVGVTNEAEVEQTSEKEWHPHSSGVVINNYGTISSSTNFGKISSCSTLATQLTDDTSYYVFAAGFATQNYGTIEGCTNSGQISGESKISKIYLGGIAAMNGATDTYSPEVVKCKVTASISAKTISGDESVGGIVASNSAYVYGTYIINVAKVTGSGFSGKIETSAQTVYAGGIAGENYLGEIKNSYSSAHLTNSYEGSRDNVCLAYLIGGARIASNLSQVESNYYVKTSDISFVIIVFASNMTKTEYANRNNTTQISSLDELPEGVRL